MILIMSKVYPIVSWSSPSAYRSLSEPGRIIDAVILSCVLGGVRRVEDMDKLWVGRFKGWTLGIRIQHSDMHAKRKIVPMIVRYRN